MAEEVLIMTLTFIGYVLLTGGPGFNPGLTQEQCCTLCSTVAGNTALNV